jgi:hypothetical protein
MVLEGEKGTHKEEILGKKKPDEDQMSLLFKVLVWEVSLETKRLNFSTI